ncbi:ABC transporter permease [Dyella silvatica]|uniref:ABC transporter permease n=1 Tax=Dyella silvatica TaxID=2992128 RepID=UPI00225B0F9A|nr:FtsX-like permease family protein [Dyella silvatica]
MQIQPILAALKRHKAGTFLIALQIALTLAIVCNALFIIQQRVERISRSTGMIETDLMAIQNMWVGLSDENASEPLIKADLQVLRQLPGVQDALATNSYPLRGGGWSTGVRLNPEMKKPAAQTTQYFVDDHALATMGAKLIAGRNFRPDEVVAIDPKKFQFSPTVMVTKALSDKLFPGSSALGKQIYLSDGTPPSTVVGIVERLQVPWKGGFADNFEANSTLLPVQLTGNFTTYLIRSKPGQLASVLKAAPEALFKANRMRVLPSERGVRSFAMVRQDAYKSDRGMAILMGIICVVLLGITAAGIVGLTSFWVGQRRKQIGVRRALGATKNDILTYFLTENLLIGLGGVLVGALLAMGMNLWLMKQFEMARLSPLYVITGVIVLLLLGQGSVLAPAMRAARVPPVEATRSV